MNRMTAFSITLALLGATGAFAAVKQGTLAQASPGLWELSGMPASKVPVRRCVPDLHELLVLEHRGGHCKQSVLQDDGTQMKAQFTCPGGGFGPRSVRVITPRSLRIETQGIAHNSPYSYVVQARRTGDCPSSKKPERGH